MMAVMKAKKAQKNGKVEPWGDLNSRESVERMREALRSYTAEHTQTKEKARKALMSMGIITKTGRLTKNYR
jgi:hypothetical protein